MIPLLVIAGLFFVIAVPVLAVRANLKIADLEREIGQLRAALRTQGQAAGAPVATPQPQPRVEATEPVRAPAVETTVTAPTRAPISPPAAMRAAPPPKPAKPRLDFEMKLGGGLFIWIGAVMLALAGAFLVKYSIDIGLLSPAVRILLGLLLGTALLGGGQWLRRQAPAIAQALAAAAVADWFASLFAATALYHLLSPGFGFVCLAVVTAIGIALALREGPFVGIVGLAGGFITPAIVASGTPQAGVLFAYLFLIQLGALILQHKRGWWYLAALGIGGGLAWALFWAFWDSPTQGARLATLWLPLFLLATDVTQLWSLYGKGGVAVTREMTLTARTASIGCFLLMALWLMAGSYRLDDWGFLIVLALAHLAAAHRFTAEEIPALVGAAIAIGAYAAWSPLGYDWSAHGTADRTGDLIATGIVLGAAFGLGGFWFEMKSARPAHWAGLSTLGTAFIFGGAYLNLNAEALWLSWSVQAAILGALHLAAAVWLNQLRQREPRYAGALGTHALAAAGFAALFIWLEIDWLIGRSVTDSGGDFLRAGLLSSTWAALALGLLRFRDRAILMAAYAFAGLSAGALVIGGFILANPMLDSIDVGTPWVFNRLLLVYALPAALLLLTAEKLPKQAAQAVGLIALVAGFAWITLTIRQIAHGPVLTEGEITNGEQTGYSAVWMLYGLSLLGLGSWKRNQMLRYASAVVVLLTVCKLFLIDASNVTGLLRVASFLGLGLSLIGIGYLYQRLLFKRRE